MRPLRVAIVDDNALFRDMLRNSLSQSEDVDVVATAGTVKEARATIGPREVDVAILDIELPDGNGVGLGVSLQKMDPHIAIVLLSAHSMLDVVWQLPGNVGQGWSYLSKTSTVSLDTLLGTIREAARGKVVVDPALLQPGQILPSSPLAPLTDRQREILGLVAAGLSNDAIAQRLNLAEKSVVNHLTAIYTHLRIPEDHNTRVAATLIYLREHESVAP